MVLKPIEVERHTGNGDDAKLRVPPQGDALAPWDGPLRVVGAPSERAPRRLEGGAKVTGQARYTSDVRLPGQVHAAVLRSPHAHAEIVSVDTSEAEALDGVVAVLSREDDLGIDWYSEGVPLFSDKVRFVGDEVAAVAAVSEEIAQDALRLIRVDYRPLECVTSLDRALLDDAPTIHEGGNRAREPETYERGDIDAGRTEAEVTIEQTYSTQTALHNALEPHGAVASWTADGLLVYESTQGVNEIRELLSETLELPTSKVRVLCEQMGGGFGAKQTLWKQTVLAALLSRQCGRPVQLMLDREGECLATGNRHPTRQRVRLGAKRDGTLTFIEVDARAAIGAYSTAGEGSAITGIYEHLYRCENVRTSQEFVYTNTGPAVAFRAPGYVEGCFALESAMDELARALELDPLELRRRNYSERDQKQDRPWSSPDALEACYRKLDEVFGWTSGDRTDESDKSDESDDSDSSSRRRGRGLAAHEWIAGMGSPPAEAWVRLHQDATVELVTCTQDIGTGTRTVLAQVVAEVLGVDVDRISVRLGDTAPGLSAPVSEGSFTVPTLAPAVRQAAEDLRDRLLEATLTWLERDDDPDQLVLRDGLVVRPDERSEDEELCSIRDVTEALAPHGLLGHGARRANPEDVTIRPFGAMAAEVEVDVQTGEVTVLEIVDAPDCGRIVHRKAATSQVLGGVTQGVGFALTEERQVDAASGIVLNAGLEEYKLPTVCDIPTIRHAEVDLPDLAANPLGVKGLGELPLIPVAAAIANAVYDATGVRIRDLPITRERVLEALERAASEGGER